MRHPIGRSAAVVLALLVGAAASAQSPDPPESAAGSPAEAQPSPTPSPTPDVMRPPLDVEMETGGYTYNSLGRRDPFVSLQRPVSADRGPKTRKPGMEGFLIQEIALKGIVQTKGGGLGSAKEPGFIAVILGADGKSYFVKAGQRLYDGQIIDVNATAVVFRQEVTDPLSPVKTREVRKYLNATEEARQ